MNKKTKMLVGLALVLGVGYYFWEKSKKDKASDTKVNFAPKPKAKAKKVVDHSGEYIN